MSCRARVQMIVKMLKDNQLIKIKYTKNYQQIIKSKNIKVN